MPELNVSTEVSDEFDVRILLRSIIKRWKIILILTVLGAIIGGVFYFTNKTTYKATATVFLNSATTPYNINPQFLLQSESIKNKVLESTGLSEADLPDITIAAEKNDKNVLNITAKSGNPALAVKVVNAWADACLLYAKDYDTLLQTDVEKARIRLNELDNQLSTVLIKAGLQNLSWSEMVAITGGADTSYVNILNNSEPLPEIPLSQQTQIKELVRNITLAQWEYYDISKQLITKEYTSNGSVFVLNHAAAAEKDTNLLNKVTIPLGAIAGFFIAILFVLLANWWKAE